MDEYLETYAERVHDHHSPNEVILVSDLAKKLGATIHDNWGTFPRLMIRRPGRMWINIPRPQSILRDSLTIARSLAIYFLVYRLEDIHHPQMYDLDDLSEETRRRVDYFAHTLAMPRHRFLEEHAKARPGRYSLYDLADTFGVEPRAVTTRMEMLGLDLDA